MSSKNKHWKPVTKHKPNMPLYYKDSVLRILVSLPTQQQNVDINNMIHKVIGKNPEIRASLCGSVFSFKIYWCFVWSNSKMKTNLLASSFFCCMYQTILEAKLFFLLYVPDNSWGELFFAVCTRQFLKRALFLLYVPDNSWGGLSLIFLLSWLNKLRIK